MPTNNERAADAEVALRSHPDHTYLEEGIHVAAVDLLTNLMHLMGLNEFSKALQLAEMNYEAEVELEE